MMSRTKKILIWAGVLVAVAVAFHLLFFRNQTKEIEINDPQKAQMIRDFRQSLQPGPPQSPQQKP
jgi:hypothetical protein